MSAVVLHPAHRLLVPRLAELVRWLRDCESPGDYYEFQRHLAGDLYRVEERSAQCSHVIKRLRAGRSVPTEYPELSCAPGSARMEDWEVEAFVYERMARQLRTAGDGLAWRCFGYDRRVIIVLSRNDSPGPMYGKSGLPYELGRVEECWRERRQFALLHDLTNCLRIADATEFTTEGGAVLHEVKRSPRTGTRQMQRARTAVDALVKGSPLPGEPTGGQVVEVAVSYKSNLRELNDLVQLAKEHGCRGMKLPHGRALVAMSLPAVTQRWADNPREGERAIASTRRGAIRRAGIADSTHHLRAVSADTASRSSTMPPFSIYPLEPEDCAALISDHVVFESVVCVDALVSCLERAGLAASITLPNEHGEVPEGQIALFARWQDRGLTLPAMSLEVLLFELLQPDVWAAGIRELLMMSDPPARAVLVFADEADVWR